MIVVTEDRSVSRIDPFERALGDGEGCVSFLLHAATGGGCTMGDLVRGAPIAHLSWRTLRTLGVVMQVAPGSPLAAVACAHPTLSRIFAESPWCGAWTMALLTLPGALRGERMLFGRTYAATVLLPRRLLVGAS